MNERDELRGWITAILNRTGWTATELARQAGLAGSTLTRFMAEPDAPILSGRTQSKIRAVATAHGVGPLTLTGKVDAQAVEKISWRATHRLLSQLTEHGLADLGPGEIDNLAFVTAKTIALQLAGGNTPPETAEKLDATLSQIREMHNLRDD